MKLKPLKHYYGEHLKKCLRDGDNKFIKNYTTNGFKKSYQMWNDYSHDSIQAFFNDFIKEYPEDYLTKNCRKCYTEMTRDGSSISFDDLFDILIRRLVIDAYIGFKSEDIIRENLISNGIIIHDYDIVTKKDEIYLDINCGIDIMAFGRGCVKSFIQVKNTSTFSFDGKYIIEKRKEFFEKEKEANEYLADGVYRKIIFFIYDKNAFINEGEFRFYVNPATDKCHFFLDELINPDGTLRIRVGKLKSRKL
jgi:hypothetical protein